jgi:hypothetical protein
VTPDDARRLDDAADIILEHLPDAPELLQSIAPALTPEGRRELSARLELCPVHLIDVAICEDDATPDCYPLRRA